MIWAQKSLCAEQVQAKTAGKARALTIKIQNVVCTVAYAPPTVEAKGQHLKLIVETMEASYWSKQGP